MTLEMPLDSTTTTSRLIHRRRRRAPTIMKRQLLPGCLTLVYFLLVILVPCSSSLAALADNATNTNSTTHRRHNHSHQHHQQTQSILAPNMITAQATIHSTTNRSTTQPLSSILLYHNSTNMTTAPQWMLDFVAFRKRLFLKTVEPVICFFLGPMEEEQQQQGVDTVLQVVEAPHGATSNNNHKNIIHNNDYKDDHIIHESQFHRRLGFLPNYVEDVSAFKETSMSFATLFMLFMILTCVFVIFLSCFYHNQKTSPLFSSPRRHRLPKLVPPPLPVDGYFKWVKVCFLLSDEEIIHRIGYDSLIFLRFHRLALRCIVKMSVFSFVVLLPLNFTGGGHANANDIKGYVGSLFFTDFLRFTMANVSGGSPRLWVHCFAAYLLTGIVVRELLREYETFNSIRHTYLLSREPHLRTVLVTNIPRHLRSRSKINSYFRHVYPQAVQQVVLCQNVLTLEHFVNKRTGVLSQIEKELLMLCRTEKYKLFRPHQNALLDGLRPWMRCSCWSSWSLALQHILGLRHCLEQWQVLPGTQERLTRLYTQLEALNQDIEQEQRRRRRVMKMLDRMEAGGEGSQDIDYLLAQTSPHANGGNRLHGGMVDGLDVAQRKRLGLVVPSSGSNNSQQPCPTERVLSSNAGASSAAASSSGVLRARSPTPKTPMAVEDGRHHAAATTDGDEFEDEHDDSSKQKKKKMGMTQRFSRMMGVSTPTKQSGSSENTPNTANDEGTYHLYADGRSTGPPSEHSHRQEQEQPQPLSSRKPQPEAHIEDHLNEVSDKAFVVMRTFTAATIAIQSMHSSRPGSMQVCTAPEPRDILWQNICVSKGATRTRSYLGEFLVLLIITFYVVPIALVSLLVSESALVSSSPRLEQLDHASAFFSSAIAMVQPLCVVGIQQLLPPLFMLIGRMEGLVSFSEVQMRAFSRYFLFQVLNIFLVTTIAGSIFDTIAIIVENPEAAFEMLGNSLPRMSSFFITFITMKTFLGLGLELVRTMALVQGTVRYLLFPNATLRTQRNILMGMRAVDDPGWFPYHKILAQDMLVVVLSVVFAVVAPLVLFPCALFCLFSRIMWTHHHLYVYESVFETGGQFWPKIFRRFIFGLIIAQMTITGQFILKEARHEAYATIALMFMTYFFLRSTRARFDPTSSTLPLEVATVMDIRLHQERQLQRKVAEATASTQQAAGGTPQQGPSVHSRADPGRPRNTEEENPSFLEDNIGARIGPYDPFEMAYIQPALRANPRARPEQPFPPAQLGRDELGGGNGMSALNASGELPVPISLDNGGRVRLKGLHQQDRRLLNRWWSEQIDKCGDQNVLRILMGEECGTLKIAVESRSPTSNCIHNDTCMPDELLKKRVVQMDSGPKLDMV